MDGLNCLGTDDEVGFDFGKLFQATGGVAQYGISAYEEEEAKKKAEAAESSKVSAAIAADRDASNAVAKADISAQLKSPSASIDATAAQRAITVQDRAGAAGLSSAGAEKRAAAADKAYDAAVAAAQKAPKDAYKAAIVRAWQATVNKAHNTAIAASDGSGFKGYGAEESFWTRRVLGPIPGYGVVLGGVGLLGAVGLVVKKFLLK